MLSKKEQRLVNSLVGAVVHIAQYSRADHITFQEEVSFWRKDGYKVKIHYDLQNGDVWLLTVLETASTVARNLEACY